jgi:hypothetical protein
VTGLNRRWTRLDPAGHGAEQIAALFWAMAAGAGLIWLGIVGQPF